MNARFALRVYISQNALCQASWMISFATGRPHSTRIMESTMEHHSDSDERGDGSQTSALTSLSRDTNSM